MCAGSSCCQGGASENEGGRAASDSPYTARPLESVKLIIPEEGAVCQMKNWLPG